MPVIWEWEQANEDDPLDYLDEFDVESNGPDRLDSELGEEDEDDDQQEGSFDTRVPPKSTGQI